MGTTKISEFLFNIKGKVAKQHAEPIIEKNLYTILGFKRQVSPLTKKFGSYLLIALQRK